MKVNTLDDDCRGLTRRQLLGLATLTSAGLAAASVGVPEAKAAPKPGEQHEPLEDFKHDLEGSEGWVGEGGSAKESTVKQLPVATSIAGVSMRLKPGGLRELHWHAIAAEWAYVVKGNVRTTVISPNGEAAQDDFGPGTSGSSRKVMVTLCKVLVPVKLILSSALMMDTSANLEPSRLQTG